MLTLSRIHAGLRKRKAPELPAAAASAGAENGDGDLGVDTSQNAALPKKKRTCFSLCPDRPASALL